MQSKFAEISEITRISAIKLRTFASDEKAAKFRLGRGPYISILFQYIKEVVTWRQHI